MIEPLVRRVDVGPDNSTATNVPILQERTINLPKDFLFFEEKTWPDDVKRFVAENAKTFLQAERHDENVQRQYNAPDNSTPMAFMPPNPYFQDREDLTLELEVVLRPHALRGWHCTRLTDEECCIIKSSGMSLPTPELLTERIKAAANSKCMDLDHASKLISRNQAGEINRSNKIWFCFFHPKKVGESGVGRFFRSWGGEALYNTHEGNSITGPVLRAIGSPRIIEAVVPFEFLHNSLGGAGERLFRRYLTNHSCYTTREDLDFESYSKSPIPSSSIIRIITHPSADFNGLTNCNSWSAEYRLPVDGQP